MTPRGQLHYRPKYHGGPRDSHPCGFGKWEMKFDACHEGGYSELSRLQPACPVSDLDLASIHVGGLRQKLKLMTLSQREAEILVRS